MTGNELIRNPRYNKGMAFTKEERARLHLQGLLPSAVLSQELQVERVSALLPPGPPGLRRGRPVRTRGDARGLGASVSPLD